MRSPEQYRQIAAIVCNTLDQLHATSQRPGVTLEELVGQIKLAKHFKEEALIDDLAREARFHSLCTAFGEQHGDLCPTQ